MDPYDTWQEIAINPWGRRMPSIATKATLAQRSGDTGPAPALTDRSLSFLVRQAHRAFVARLADQLVPHDVGTAEWAVLRMLWLEEGLTQVALADRMRVRKASLTSVLSTLERKGFLRRTQRGDDRRKYHLFLTRRGRELETELLPIGAAINRRARAGVDPEDAEFAARVLERIIANLAAQ